MPPSVAWHKNHVSEQAAASLSRRRNRGAVAATRPPARPVEYSGASGKFRLLVSVGSLAGRIEVLRAGPRSRRTGSCRAGPGCAYQRRRKNRCASAGRGNSMK